MRNNANIVIKLLDLITLLLMKSTYQ